MEKEKIERYIEPFAAYFDKHPRYISNSDIQSYLDMNNYKNNPGLVEALHE